MAHPHSILLVEEEGLMREALVEMLGGAPSVKIVGVASTAREARVLLSERAPSILITDLMLKDGSAVELVRSLRRQRQRTRVVVLTDLQDGFAVSDALSAGALGYVLKRQPMRDLLEAIEEVAAGRNYLSPSLALEQTCGAPNVDQRIGLNKLSSREREILRLIAAGHTSAEIAQRLCISTSTIDTHRSNMYRKLALRNTVDLMRFATAHGIGMPASGTADQGPE